MKVAALTKGGEIPVLAILLVAVEVVGSEHVASGTVIGVVAPLTTVAGLIFYPGGNLVPVVRVAVTHFLTLPGLYQADAVIYALELVNQSFNTRGNLGYNTRVAPNAPPGALPLETIGEYWFRVTNFILCVNRK